MKKNKKIEGLVQEVAAAPESEGTTEVTQELAPEPVKLNTKKLVEVRRGGIAELVNAKLTELNKPITHTGLFHELFPGHAEGKEAVQKWNDIGKALQASMKAGFVVETKLEGKRRTTYALKAAEIPADEAASESTTEESQEVVETTEG